MSEQFFQGDAIGVSKYFRAFERLRKEYPGIMTLSGDNVLVERLPPVEVRTKSGLILNVETSTHRDSFTDSLTEFGLVLATGPGLWADEGGDIPCNAKPGDVILLPSSTFWYSGFGSIANYEAFSIGRVRDGQIPLWFKDYKKAFEVLSNG